MSDSNTNIGGNEVKTGMSSTMSASVLLQTYTQTISSTPDLKLLREVDSQSNSNVVEDLPKHQEIARTNALYYLNRINPSLVATTADIIGFGNLWNAEYNLLLQLAQNLDENNNKNDFIQGINNLIRQTQQTRAKCDSIKDELERFSGLITMDAANFREDENNVFIALSGESGQIEQLEKQINAYNQAINKDMAIIAAGSTADVVGVLAITVGVLGELESVGASTALVVGGLAVIAGGTAGVGIASKNLKDANSELANATKALDIAQLSYASTKQASETILSLQNAVQAGITAVIELQNSWASLEEDLKNVIDALDFSSPDRGIWLVSTLNAANQDWQDTLELAKNIQQNGTLKVVKNTEAVAV